MFGFLGFGGFWTYYKFGEIFPFTFFIFFGFFSFFFEGKLSHILEDELFQENKRKAQLEAYKIGFKLLFVVIWLMASWCPKYENLKTVKHWFNEWNTRGKVIIWDIKQFFHKENQTVVEWYFKNEMNTGSVEEFDGISLIEWTEDNKIKSLKEYGCNLNNYNPYQHSDNPQFRDEKTNWF